MQAPIVAGVKELWEQAILPYNLPLTILLGLVVGFWILTLIGGVSFDADLDLDADTATGDLGDLPAAMLRAVNAGIVVVISAGNDGDMGTFQMLPCGPRSDAAPVPGYHGHWCIDTKRIRGSSSTSACVPLP